MERLYITDADGQTFGTLCRAKYHVQHYLTVKQQKQFVGSNIIGYNISTKRSTPISITEISFDGSRAVFKKTKKF